MTDTAIRPPFVRLTKEGIDNIVAQGYKLLEGKAFHDPEATTWCRILQQLQALSTPEAADRVPERRKGNDGLSHRRNHNHDTSNRFRGDGKSTAHPEERKPPREPMQPVMLDEHGVARFKANKIVLWLLSSGRFNLNELACMGFPAEDEMQLAQLIGYSVSGYGDLSYVTDESYERASEAAHQLHDASTGKS